MGKAPAFQLYASDFYMDTADWTCPQIGVYVRLLMYEWINGGLSPKISDLARIAKVNSRTMHKMWSLKIENKFMLNGAGLLINRRLEEEREKQLKRWELQTKKGIQGAKKRWDKTIAGAIPEPIAQAQPEDSSSSSSSLYINNNSKLENSQTIAPAKPEHPKSDYSTPPQKDLEFIEHDDGSVEILNPKAIILKGKWYKNQIGNFVCSICQKEYSFYESLQEHLATH